MVVVTRGQTLRCFVMRFSHLTVDEFEALENPGNCDVVTIGPVNAIAQPPTNAAVGRRRV